ncbi:acyloxyacyl hydrolase [Aquimarina gracilis]|uniref:Acyloxyacyl hydrolase n=1 Tax=Aquimarina gracilis TaxID=874422 RepID=A0ABU5ZR62_9FLAO|nr:acyloxyacyl hydrolase [Aquimarina gracilis]MEB3344550.1 acyloxyacyl hydrolase [Aquimarina gracilis]
MLYKEYYLLIFFIGITLSAQDAENKNKNSFFVVPEISIGKTMEANTGFPETDLQKSFFVSFGNYNSFTDQEWASELGHPKTGISFGVTDFGNIDKIGIAYTLMPFIEIGLFRKHTKRWNVSIGMGTSYINRQYDAETNPFNLAVTTEINWSFRSFLYYDIFKRKQTDWRLGFGYAHFSNGHTRLPNQGLNSFLVNVSTIIGKESERARNDKNFQKKEKNRSSENYFSFRSGIGQNVLSRIFNDQKEVYSLAFSGGKVINKTFKFGAGAYYRFYEHYYDHIKENGQLVSEQVPEYRENPYRYATNFGFFGSTELLIGHVGVEFDLGINIYKPFYKIDWQLSQGYFYNGEYAKLGELDWYYEVKRTVSSRLGIKYYLFNTYRSPRNNLFIGANINANLGQADFSEVSLGYAYRFNIKDKKERIN